jgi:hypothetical protein
MGGMMAPAYVILGASPLVIPLLISLGVAIIGVVTLIARAMGAH